MEFVDRTGYDLFAMSSARSTTSIRPDLTADVDDALCEVGEFDENIHVRVRAHGRRLLLRRDAGARHPIAGRPPVERELSKTRPRRGPPRERTAVSFERT